MYRKQDTKAYKMYGYDYLRFTTVRLRLCRYDFCEIGHLWPRSFLLNFQTILMLFVNDCPTEVAENRKSLNINMEHIFQMCHISYDVTYDIWNIHWLMSRSRLELADSFLNSSPTDPRWAALPVPLVCHNSIRLALRLEYFGRFTYCATF